MSEFGFAEMGYRRSASSLREEAEWEVLSCVDELCHHLYDFSRNDLVVYGRPHFGHCFRLVREAIALLSSEQGEYLISREPSLMKRIEFVRSRLIVWTDAFEQEACQSYRAGCLDHPYLRAVSGQLDYEVSWAALHKSAQVLFIGSGSFPGSAIRLASYGIKVTCAEISEEAVWYSQNLIKAMSLPIEVRHNDGADLRLSEFTHIWIASLVPNKRGILAKVQINAAKGTVVIVRFGNFIKELFNYPFELEPEFAADWEIIHRRDGTLCDSIVLSRS